LSEFRNSEEKGVRVKGELQVNMLTVGKLKVEVCKNSGAAAFSAAVAAAKAIQALADEQETVAVIFATGASQIDTLAALTEMPAVPWHRVIGFHMDEYLNLDLNHLASFRRYLRERLTCKVKMKEFCEIDGNAPDPGRFAREYAAKLQAADPKLCLLGIGENGHLAFNDPSVANFDDPLDAKIVHLDAVCRAQQVAEGWFQTVEEVPTSAISLTVPMLMRVPKLVISVPGGRKAEIVRRTLSEPITPACPATILRTHPDATLYLDLDSAAKSNGLSSRDAQ
jgi:glucosamine-6-phosphate deaminase